MQYCTEHPEEISKLSKVKAQVSEVKGVMMENIEKVRRVLFSLYILEVELDLGIHSFIVLINNYIEIPNLLSAQ